MHADVHTASPVRFCKESNNLRHSLASQVSAAHRLEIDDDVCDLQISFFLQMSQDPGPEKDLALADAEQVGVQLQGLDLFQVQDKFFIPHYDEGRF